MNKITPYTLATVPIDWHTTYREFQGRCYNKWREYKKIIDSFEERKVPENEQQWILKAIHDFEAWDWFMQCNGANLVSEPNWDGIFSPEYVYHDYAWTKYGPTWTSNKRMYLLQNRYGMSTPRSAIRWLGVTLFGMPVHYVTWNFNRLFAKPAKPKPKGFKNTIFKK